MLENENSFLAYLITTHWYYVICDMYYVISVSYKKLVNNCDKHVENILDILYMYVIHSIFINGNPAPFQYREKWQYVVLNGMCQHQLWFLCLYYAYQSFGITSKSANLHYGVSTFRPWNGSSMKSEILRSF